MDLFNQFKPHYTEFRGQVVQFRLGSWGGGFDRTVQPMEEFLSQVVQDQAKLAKLEKWFEIIADTGVISLALVCIVGIDRLTKDALPDWIVAVVFMSVGGLTWRWFFLIRPKKLEEKKQATLKVQLEQLRQKLVAKQLAIQVKRHGLDAQLAGRGQKAKSPRTVSGNMLVLELALDLAVAAGTLTVNPLEGIKKPRPSKQMFSKKHQISPETFDTILDSTRKKPGFARQGADLAELMASTGMRIGEANLLTWANVDWGRRELVAHNGKGRIRSGTQNDVKRLPFHPRLEALLRRLWGNGQKLDSRVATVSQCSGTLESACKAAGIPKLTQHDMRHLFATWCIEAGVDIPTVATWLGHRDGGALLMKTYHHLRAVHSHSQAEKLSSLAPKRPIDPASDVSQVNPGPR